MIPNWIKLAVVIEVAVVLRTLYVAYRWWSVGDGEAFGPFLDLVPFSGNFSVVVAPWVFAALFIPISISALAIGERVIKASISN